ncbi:MAG TPA: transposase [Candidatus Paceibacterota bacterium]
MPSRKTVFAIDEYYHICNRGNRKQNIFLDDYDRARFLFLILYGQSPKALINVGRHAAAFVKNKKFNISQKVIDKILSTRVVELHSFALMDNHFHLIVQETKENGIVTYMQKVLTALSKYHNTKYAQTGHLLQGPFRSVHITSNEQLRYASAYVHRNPTEIKGWKNREHEYPWSSYSDYKNENRWGKLLSTVILEQFENGNDYHEWVKESGAKDLPEDYLENLN